MEEQSGQGKILKARFIHLAVVLGLFMARPAAATIYYVSLSSTNPVSPYTSWATASTNIQSAIALTHSNDTVLVSNGVYQTGTQHFFDPANTVLVGSRIVVSNGVTVSSVNGPASTVIQGGTVSCACLLTNATLYGFTLNDGSGSTVSGGGSLGGGAYCLTTNTFIFNCIISANIANAGAGVYLGTMVGCILSNNTATGFTSGSGALFSGGGACGSVLNGCILSGNTAAQGGGAFNCILNSCELIGNSATSSGAAGGGAFGGYLNNCLVVSNTLQLTSASAAAVCSNALNDCLILDNYATGSPSLVAVGSKLTNCTVCYNTNIFGDVNKAFAACTMRSCIIYSNAPAYTPEYSGNDIKFCRVEPQGLSSSGSENITNDPAFANSTNDFHLTANSPCINSGDNLSVASTTDYDGNTRVVAGTVDMGAYEYQTPASMLSYAWAQQYGLATDGSADFTDIDHIGMNNWQKWIAGLNPTNAASTLKLLSPSAITNGGGVLVSWQSVTNRWYTLQRGVNPEPSYFSVIQSNIVGQTNTTTFTDSTATNRGPYYYRLTVQE